MESFSSKIYKSTLERRDPIGEDDPTEEVGIEGEQKRAIPIRVREALSGNILRKDYQDAECADPYLTVQVDGRKYTITSSEDVFYMMAKDTDSENSLFTELEGDDADFVEQFFKQDLFDDFKSALIEARRENRDQYERFTVEYQGVPYEMIRYFEQYPPYALSTTYGHDFQYLPITCPPDIEFLDQLFAEEQEDADRI